MKKTYGVYGMMEYTALIPTKAKVMRIHFSGGALTGCGIRPALYSTDNPVIQYFIERSPQFRSRKIQQVVWK